MLQKEKLVRVLVVQIIDMSHSRKTVPWRFKDNIDITYSCDAIVLEYVA